MGAIAVGLVDERNQPIEDEALAAACTTTTMLITADRAADVEHLARRVHAASDRAAFPFVHTPAAALPLDPAALTQACTDLLDAASGGSVLLCDVEQTPATVQDRLIETFAGLQSAREPARRMRLVAGTTTILRDRISDGTFSERLFYRLNTIHVVVKDAAN